ncbi:MAG: class I SAM-dependent DNA methyltransferase [Planctomycetota bacterium]
MPADHPFLAELDDKLWNAADRLRSSLDAAVYKHAVLGLIFLKYVSDAFEERREQLKHQFADRNHEYWLGGDPALEHEQLEVRDYYTEGNVFWVPALARWSTIKANAKTADDTVIEITNGHKSTYTMRGLARLLDDALAEIEKENPKLKGVLVSAGRNYGGLELAADKLVGLVNLFSEVPFRHESLHAKDILGHVYEYFLGQFAQAEGKKGGQYYTPKAIVTLIVEMLEPYQGRVYDPCCGSGGFFVQSAKFIERHADSRQYLAEEQKRRLSIYGQESNPTTWRLACMNLAIRGIDYDLGKEPKDTLLSDAHPDLRADYVMANPPFNMKEWGGEQLAGDPRWRDYPTPPESNANFAWLLHMLHHLHPTTGSLGLLLANGSMSSSTNNEGEIRRQLVQRDLVECMVALPGQLFTNTQIPACIWFLTKNKAARGGMRARHGEVLFVDARELGYMVDRVLRDFHDEEIRRITDAFHRWRSGKGYADEIGFCKSVDLAAIEKEDFVLTPGRFVGSKPQQDDGGTFEQKMQKLIPELREQFRKGAELEARIRQNLKRVGYEV